MCLLSVNYLILHQLFSTPWSWQKRLDKFLPLTYKEVSFWIQYTKYRRTFKNLMLKGVSMENTLGGVRVNKRKSLREEVYESLRRSIIHGKLKGGQRLIEETLAHQVGISRTPVREAFHKLERDDLVARLPKGGFAVKKFTREDVEEIFGIRSALESYAAYLATSHITPERLALLEKKVEESEKALESQEFDKVVQLHTEFHDILYKSSKKQKTGRDDQ